MRRVVAADKIFTGEEWLSDFAIVINGNAIADVIPANKTNKAQRYNNCIIAPAFIDLQVYGAAGKLLGAHPHADTLQVMRNEFLKQGCALFQPTVATNSTGVFKSAVDAVRSYWHAGGAGVYGLHLEGPWINPEKRGAHAKEFIHSPAIHEVEEMLEYGKGVITMITLAPEVCSRAVIDLILSHNIIISAGHSNATYEQATEAFNNGVGAVTHLFNAMTGLHHRAPGLAGAALNHYTIMSSIIPDGHHVDFAAIQIAKKFMGERLFAITDAVTETAEGLYRHTLVGDKYECNGTLSGSALSMYQCFVNLVKEANIEVGEALRMCSLYPARLLGCNATYGCIAPGAVASFIVLDADLHLKDVINGIKL